MFYATNGGVSVNQATRLNGDILAPNSSVTFNGGSSTETGFIEANTITL